MAWSKRKKWLVLGACSVPLVVVLAMAAQNESIDGSQVSGTVAPAERHAASQFSADVLDTGTGSAEGSSGGDQPSVEKQDVREATKRLKRARKPDPSPAPTGCTINC